MVNTCFAKLKAVWQNVWDKYCKKQMRIFLLVITLLTVLAQAQLKGFSLGPYIETGLPTGHISEINKNGYGTGLGADIRLGKLGLTGSAGIMHFGGKMVDKGDGLVKMPAINAIPLRVGIKYRIAPALYAKFESGVSKFINSNESAIIVSPGIAVRVFGIELAGKYEIWKRNETYSFWGLKAGFNF
jgi:hypothetical protein